MELVDGCVVFCPSLAVVDLRRGSLVLGRGSQTVRGLLEGRRGPSDDFMGRSSAPQRCPRRVSPQRVADIEELQRCRMSGSQIAAALSMPRSTVGLVLRRRALGRLSLFDPKPPVVRYERAAPGELIRLDIKTLGKIDGVGHRITGQHKGHRSRLFAATLRHAGVRHVRNPALHAAHHW